VSVEPGTTRHTRMMAVKAALGRHPKGLRYDELADLTGLSHAAVCRAADDLRYEEDIVVSIPAPKNDYKVVLGWKKSAELGEESQARHNATRLARQSHRLNSAAKVEKTPARAAMLAMAARHVAASAEDLKALAASF